MAGSRRKKMAKGDVVFNAVIYTFFALFIAYPFFQKHFIDGLKVGSIKD